VLEDCLEGVVPLSEDVGLDDHVLADDPA